jgi:methyl-accepting chemotaxis protein
MLRITLKAIYFTEGIINNLKVSHKFVVLSLTLVIAFSLTIGWVYSRLKVNLTPVKHVEIQHT